jgi:hypothetical protein
MENDHFERLTRLINEMQQMRTDRNRLIDSFSRRESRLISPDLSMMNDLRRRLDNANKELMHEYGV